MRTLQSKFGDAWRGTVHAAKQYGKGVYVKGMEKSLIMSDTTAEVRWTMCRLVSLVDTQTGFVSQSAHNLHDLIITFHR